MFPRAELVTNHEDHVRAVGQGFDVRAAENVAANGGDALPFQRLAKSGSRKAGDSKDFLGRPGFIAGTFRQRGEARSHFAADADNHQIARQRRHRRYVGVRGPRKRLV